MQEPKAPYTSTGWQVFRVQGFYEIRLPGFVVGNMGSTQSYMQLLLLGLGMAAPLCTNKCVAAVPLMGWPPVALSP